MDESWNVVLLSIAVIYIIDVDTFFYELTTHLIFVWKKSENRNAERCYAKNAKLIQFGLIWQEHMVAGFIDISLALAFNSIDNVPTNSSKK